VRARCRRRAQWGVDRRRQARGGATQGVLRQAAAEECEETASVPTAGHRRLRA
jgi:hypothetical protein